MSTSFTDSEKERIRYHLGYLGVSTAASVQFGIPRPLQTLFLVETSMTNILPAAIPRVQRVLAVMDGIEEKLVDAQDRLAAIQLDSLKLREDETEKLENEYVRWGCRLADILGCPIYPYATRYKGRLGGVSAGSIPVKS